MPRPRTRPAAESSPRGRQRASHSMEAVLTAAVALLDEAGQSALTFRALASRLGTGVGTIYWYVSNKDELFDRATDHAVGGILTAVEEQPQSDDPIADLREMAIVLFDAMMDRPWLAAYFMRNTDVQDHSLRLYDKLGRQTLRLDLTSRQRFHAVSAIVGVVVGTAADLGAELPQELLDGDVDRVEYLSRYAERWRSLDAAEFPFVHEIADEFAEHDDREQFLAALDLTLAGLRLQAGTRVPEGTTGKPDATANGSPPAS